LGYFTPLNNVFLKAETPTLPLQEESMSPSFKTGEKVKMTKPQKKEKEENST
jgi:hypothetical protein